MHKRKKTHKKESEWFCVKKHRTKTERKKIKRETKERRARNKRLIFSYPFLKAVSWYDLKPIENKRFDYVSLWDEVPKGWTRNFGRIMCDEIKNALKSTNQSDDFYFEQCKEKYGGMRIYATAPTEVQHILSIYEFISENVCCSCGKPHSPIVSVPWVSPYCEKCYYKYYVKPYEEVAPKDKEAWKIPNVIQRRRFSVEGTTIEEEDITDRVKKIEERWEQIQRKRSKNLRKGKKNVSTNNLQKEEVKDS